MTAAKRRHMESLLESCRERFRDPKGWLLDQWWPLRRCYLGWKMREWPWNVPNHCRVVGMRRPAQYVFDYFEKLEPSNHAD